MTDDKEQKKNLSRVVTMGDGHDSPTAAENEAVPTVVILTCRHGYVVAAHVVTEDTSVAKAVRYVEDIACDGKVTKVRGAVFVSWCEVCCGARRREIGVRDAAVL